MEGLRPEKRFKREGPTRSEKAKVGVGLRVWIDALTPKQLIFFDAVSRKLTSYGHEVFATTRRYHDVGYVVERLGLNVEVLGSHGGRGLRRKLEASLERAALLTSVVVAEKVDVALSFSSPEAARVAFGLGIPHYAVNDSPHATAVARLTVPLCKMLFTPSVIPTSSWMKYGIEKERVKTYNALDPAAWLKHPERWPPQNEVEEEAKGAIVVRLEESQASYLLKEDTEATGTIVKMAEAIPERKFILLARYEEQEVAYGRIRLSNVRVCHSPFFGANMLKQAALFVGRGGTMTAEAALLGVPTICNYPGPRTYVQRFLERHGLAAHAETEEELVRLVKKMLKDETQKGRLREKAERTLREMEDPSDVIAKTLAEDAGS
jgi:hypothetical protein